jgi:hypothetical protein
MTKLLDKLISLNKQGDKLDFYLHEKQKSVNYIEEKQYEPIINMSL